jgi:tetratricopeptide (TPR) repeat protein
MSRFDVGLQRFRDREYEPAARAFLEVIRETPANAQAWSYYGIALSHLGRSNDAEAALARAVALAPANGEAWFHLGVARSQQDEWKDAAEAYRRAVALAPDDVVAWHRLGVALAESGDERGAASAFERALVLSRDVPAEAEANARGALARSVAGGRIDDHADEGGAHEGTREVKSWLDLALSLLSLGDQEEAIAAYERAYTLDPERARHSLFPAMLRLLTAVEGGDVPLPGIPVPAAPSAPSPEERRPRRPEVG